MGGPQNLEPNMYWDGMVANYQKFYTDRYPELDWKISSTNHTIKLEKKN